MDPHLKGCRFPIPALLQKEVERSLLSQTEFQDLQTFYPGMGLLCSLKTAPEKDIWLDHEFRLVDVLSSQSTTRSGRVSLRIEKNIPESGSCLQDVSGFRKVTHLLDPARWIQGRYSFPKHTYLPWHPESWEAASEKLQDPMNQAYVEALAAYIVSRFRESNISPHFHLLYGCFCGKAATYTYAITDSYMSYRHSKWFWLNQEKKIFSIRVDEDVADDVKQALLEQPDELDDSSDETDSEEELSGLDCSVSETHSLHSAQSSAFLTDSSEQSDSTDESHTSDDEELEIFVDIPNFPVMMIYTEASEGTMDDLLDDYIEVGCRPGTKQWDLTWKAWIFQVIAALCVGQSLIGLTHNDLHSNNVVWSKTDSPYLFYKTNDGVCFQVPTFGKIFRIIDFGRAIFRLNKQIVFSDDFKEGNDAAEQFNFGELYEPSEPEVYPNPSFDLCRFTVSVFESLFPESPPVKKGGSILSKEPDLVMHETESDLYNMLWSWLLCDDGHNVLMDPDGSERYPDFDLYKVISREVHTAIPAEQIRKPVFQCFQTKELIQTAYPLFF